jgi:hypothetical protein
MGMALVVALLIGSSWLLVSLVHRFRRKRVTAPWWIALAILVAVGIAVGVWCAFFFEYQVGPRYRFVSFPLPVAFFHLEGGEWVDFPVPSFQAWAAALTNIISVTALATSPLWLFSWRLRMQAPSGLP